MSDSELSLSTSPPAEMAQEHPSAQPLPSAVAEPPITPGSDTTAVAAAMATQASSPQRTETDELHGSAAAGVRATRPDASAGYEDDLPYVDQLPPEMMAQPSTAAFLSESAPAPEESDDELDVDAVQAPAIQAMEARRGSDCEHS